MAKAWAVLVREAGGVLLHEISGDAVKIRRFPDTEDAKQASSINAERLIKLSDTTAPPPTAILPEELTALGPLRQVAPAALLPSTARIAIAGVLTDRPDWDGIICLPERDVTHWVHVSAREIISFQGVATGRLASAFAAGDIFDKEALNDTMARPERLAAQLNAASVEDNAAAVLGHLLGAELAAMRVYWLGQDVILIGTYAPYGEALQLQGVTADFIPHPQAWHAGLLTLGQAAGFAG